MKQLCILLIFLLCSCGNIKTTYIKGELDSNGYAEKQIFEKYLEVEKLNEADLKNYIKVVYGMGYKFKD